MFDKSNIRSVQHKHCCFMDCFMFYIGFLSSSWSC